MKKTYPILFVFFLLLTSFVFLNLLSILQPNQALAQRECKVGSCHNCRTQEECEDAGCEWDSELFLCSEPAGPPPPPPPPGPGEGECTVTQTPFKWGTIKANVSGNQVIIENSSNYAFAVHRTIEGCPPPVVNEPPTHQPDEAVWVHYQLDGGSWHELVKGVEWDLSKPKCSGEDAECSYNCCQNTYALSFALSGLSPGNHIVNIRVSGHYPGPPGDYWEYIEGVSFNISAPTCTDECSPNGATQRRCSGDWVQKRTCGNYDSDPCLEWSSWTNLKNCNDDGWYKAGSSYNCCDGDKACTCQDSEYRDYYCSGGSCAYSVTNTKTTYSNCVNCNDNDGCVGTSYYDWSCINGGCISEEFTNDPRCSPQKPNVPELVSPPDDSWINQNPTLIVRVSDPNNKQVRVEFELYADFNGNRKIDIENEDKREYFYHLSDFYPSGSNISWSLDLPDFTLYSWHARARNEDGYWSDWSQYWTFHKDTIPPQAQISYNLECVSSSNFPVYLEESDELSGIEQGLVQISIEGGAWQDHKQTTEDFTYPGKEGTTYQFRYQVQDKAGNLSDWATGPSQTLTINHPPSATNLRVQLYDPCTVPYTGAWLRWDFSDPDQGDSQFARQIQVDNNPDFSSPEIDNYSEISNNVYATQVGQLKCHTTYYWRVKVWDSPCLTPSSWAEGPSFTTICDYPDPDFTWQPEKIYFSQPIQFIDQSICYDEVPVDGRDCSSEEPLIDSFNWHFLLTREDEWGETQTLFETSSTDENPEVTFPYLGDLEITLTVTDSQGRSCSKTVNTGSRFPVWVWKTWREINPACFWLKKFPCD